jgi:6-phosphogluconolactonase
MRCLLLFLFLATTASAAEPRNDATKTDTPDMANRRVYFGTYTGGGQSQGIYVCELDAATGNLTEPRLAAEAVNPSFLETHPNRKFVYAVGEISDFAGKKSGGVSAFALDRQTGKLAPNDPPSVSLPSGGGPRHFAFHPGGVWAYCNNEMTSTVSALKYDAARGAFSVLQTLSTLPDGYDGENSTAEVRVHPSGKFVYVSNRGHNSIAMFAVDAQTGRLTPLGHESTRGKVPRNFNLDPSGRWLLAANQDSGNVVVFKVDEKSGRLAATGSEVKVGAPVCVRFVALERAVK